MAETNFTHLLFEIRNLSAQCEKLDKENANLKELVYVDELTGLYNFRYLMKRLNEEICRVKRYKRDLSLIMLDVDNLKWINDNFGHQKGNQIIEDIAKSLTNSVRSIDIVARYGGDEFVVLLPDTSFENSLKVARRIMTNIENLFYICQSTKKIIKTTVSAGVSSYNDYNREGIEFIEGVDMLLRLAKQNGKNRIESLFPLPFTGTSN